jgi:predicted porin
MKSLITGLALTALGCCAFTAQAATLNTQWSRAAAPDISWDYVSAGLARMTLKNTGSDNIELDGYQLNGSYLLSDTLYLHASYNDVSGDLELEASELTVGLGIRQRVADNIDSFFEAAYVRSESSVVGFEKDTLNGFQAGAGFRYRVIPKLELAAALNYHDGGDDSATVGDVSARFRVTPMLDLYVNYQFDSDASLLGAGVALNF